MSEQWGKVAQNPLLCHLIEPVKTGPAKGLVNGLDKMLPEYYQLRGWNTEGVPTAETRKRLGWTNGPFEIPEAIYGGWRAGGTGTLRQAEWEQLFDKYASQYPAEAAELTRRSHGELPDGFIAAADAVLAPLLIARGVQNKVLEAMAMARPVVLTPEAATGIAASDGEDWLICPPDPAAMCAAIEALLSHSDAPARIGAAARAFVLGHHGWEAMLAPLAGLLGMTGEGQRHAA